MLVVGSQNEGVFTPYIKYNAKSGKWSVKDDGVETEFETFTAIFDLENIKTGWFYYPAGMAPEKIFHPSLTEKVARPAGTHLNNGKEVHNFKEGVQFNMYAKDKLNGLREFSATANATLTPILSLYNTDFFPNLAANQGKVPVVTVSTPIKVKGKESSYNYTPVLSILKWIDRPAELAGSAAANVQLAPTAPVQAAPKPVVNNVSEF